jgi:hypothetical protein
MPARLAIKRQPLIHSLIERPTQRTLRCLGIRVHNHRNRGMALAEAAQQVLELGIHNDRIHLGMIKDVLDVLLLQPIVDSDLDRARGSNAVDRFQEGGRVGSQNSDSFVFVLQ